MLINVELPSGITIKVNSDWFYSLSDKELERFYENNLLNYSYHQVITDPFDNSVIDITPYQPSDEDLEEFDTSIDYTPDE